MLGRCFYIGTRHLPQLLTAPVSTSTSHDLQRPLLNAFLPSPHFILLAIDVTAPFRLPPRVLGYAAPHSPSGSR